MFSDEQGAPIVIDCGGLYNKAGFAASELPHTIPTVVGTYLKRIIKLITKNAPPIFHKLLGRPRLLPQSEPSFSAYVNGIALLTPCI